MSILKNIFIVILVFFLAPPVIFDYMYTVHYIGESHLSYLQDTVKIVKNIFRVGYHRADLSSESTNFIIWCVIASILSLMALADQPSKPVKCSFCGYMYTDAYKCPNCGNRFYTEV